MFIDVSMFNLQTKISFFSCSLFATANPLFDFIGTRGDRHYCYEIKFKLPNRRQFYGLK